MNAISLSAHATKRVAQRGIKIPWISDAIVYGEQLFINGLKAFVITKGAFSECNSKLYDPDREIGLTVIAEVCNHRTHVVTAYKDQNSLKALKKQRGVRG